MHRILEKCSVPTLNQGQTYYLETEMGQHYLHILK